MPRGFARQQPGALAAAYHHRRRGLARAWHEGAVLERLMAGGQAGLGTRRDTEASVPAAATLLSISFGRQVSECETVECDRVIRRAAAEVWHSWCHADDCPRMCGAEDGRFRYYWSEDETVPCPLEDACETRRRDVIARRP